MFFSYFKEGLIIFLFLNILRYLAEKLMTIYRWSMRHMTISLAYVLYDHIAGLWLIWPYRWSIEPKKSFSCRFYFSQISKLPCLFYITRRTEKIVYDTLLFSLGIFMIFFLEWQVLVKMYSNWFYTLCYIDELVNWSVFGKKI